VEPVGDARRRTDLLGRKPSPEAGEPARLEPGVHRGAAELGDHDVRGLLDDQLGPALAEDHERYLVREGRRREVHRLRLPEERGGGALEREHGRVLAPLLVADLGLRHRLAHRRRRPGRGVRAEVDHDAMRLHSSP